MPSGRIVVEPDTWPRPKTELGEARAEGLPDAKQKRGREELEKAQKPYRRGAGWCKALV